MPKYTVEVGKGEKGSYKVRYSFGMVGVHDEGERDYWQAQRYYNSINIGNGFKKRLRVNGKTITRAFS